MKVRSDTWKRVRLGDLVKVTHGWPFKSEFFTEERQGRPIIVNIGNFQYTGGFRFESTTVKEYASDYPKEYALSPRDVLLVMTCQTSGGEILGIPGRIPDDGNTYLHNQRMGKVIIKEPNRIDPDFVYYLALWSDFNRELCVSASGTKILHTAPVRIEAFEFELPPLAEQKAIASILRALDDKIELNRRMNATLEAMARALFQNWFVDFDPVRAKLDGRKPFGLDEATAALFPSTFQDSTLGLIPFAWQVTRLDNIATVLMGLSPGGDSYNAAGVGIPLINGPVEFGDYFPVKTKWTENSTRFATEGDLIFCVRGSTTGRRVVSDGTYGVGRGVCAIRANDGHNSFLYQTVDVGLDRLLEKTTGSVFPSLSAPDIKGFSVLKPSNGVLEAYERSTKPLIRRIQQNHRESRNLATLRDALLPKLLSGEVRAPTERESPAEV
jgi:type I restriction enzyme S subunit